MEKKERITDSALEMPLSCKSIMEKMERELREETDDESNIQSSEKNKE